MAVQDALKFKEQGNALFLKGQYAGAEGLYSQAVRILAALPHSPAPSRVLNSPS